MKIRAIISLVIGWVVGFALFFSGAGMWSAVAAFGATGLVLVVTSE